MAREEFELISCDANFAKTILSYSKIEQLTSNLCRKYCSIKDPVSNDFGQYEECFKHLMTTWSHENFARRNEVNINSTSMAITIVILILMTLMGYFLLLNNKLNMHPYRLYAYEILSCAGFYWNWYAWYFNNLGARTLIEELAIITSVKNSYQNEFGLAVYMRIVNLFIEQQLYMLYPLLNFLLYVDLFWIIKNPFFPQRKRNRMYIIVVATTMLLIVFQFIVTI